jgi:hypothetical protein
MEGFKVQDFRPPAKLGLSKEVDELFGLIRQQLQMAQDFLTNPDMGEMRGELAKVPLASAQKTVAKLITELDDEQG